MKLDEKQLIRGFNNGYLLAKYEPHISLKFTEDKPLSNSYIRGMILGQTEFKMELTQSRLNELNQLRNQSNEKELDKDR